MPPLKARVGVFGFGVEARIGDGVGGDSEQVPLLLLILNSQIFDIDISTPQKSHAFLANHVIFLVQSSAQNPCSLPKDCLARRFRMSD